VKTIKKISGAVVVNWRLFTWESLARVLLVKVGEEMLLRCGK
jgi:hypothetical protein